MKKKLSIVAALFVAIVMFASCDQKLCYCYQTTNQGVYEEEVYTNSDTPCSALRNSSRECVEQNERMPNGGEGIAYKSAPKAK